jgi:hypothetical protein
MANTNLRLATQRQPPTALSKHSLALPHDTSNDISTVIQQCVSLASIATSE